MTHSAKGEAFTELYKYPHSIQNQSFSHMTQPSGTARFRRCGILRLLAALLATASCISFSACHDDAPEGATITRTVLVYMAAQNSLGAGNYHRADSAEIMRGRKFIPSDGRVLMFVDDNRAPRLYEVTRRTSEPRLVRQWSTDVCSANPATLHEVLRYVDTTFTSKDFGLVMWSHADGWIPPTDTTYSRQPQAVPATPSLLAFGIDAGPNGHMSNNGPQMGVEEMARAITAAGVHPRFIFFDACLMQNLETAYALRHATDYVVAAPMATPGCGSNYTNDIRHGFFTNDVADLARTYLANVQDTTYANDYADFGLSISCIRTDRLQALADALREALPHSSLTGRRSPDLQGVLNYQAYTSSYAYRPHNYDARQALRAILPEADFERVSAALDEAVTFHGSTRSFWIGPGVWTMQYVPVSTDEYRSVSMFVPQDVYTKNARFSIHGDLNSSFQQTEWYSAAGWAQTGW